MKLYYVSNNTITYKDDNGLIQFSKESAKEAISQGFGGKSKDLVPLFSSEAEAIEWARYGAKSKNKAYAVVTVELDIADEEFKKLSKVTDEDDLAKIEDTNFASIKVIDQYLVSQDRLTLIKISFAHADEKAKDVVFVEQAAEQAQAAQRAADKKDASRISSFLATVKEYAAPVLTIGSVGTGFWYGNGVPAALSFAAKLVPAAAAIPAASIAVQIAISAAVGLLAYGAFLGAKTGFNGLSVAWNKFNRTNKEKYVDDLAAAVATVKSLEAKLELSAESSFAVKLDDMLKAAPGASFDDKGTFVQGEPKPGNKLSLAQWQSAQVKAYAAAKVEDRPALKAEIYQGLKQAPAKA